MKNLKPILANLLVASVVTMTGCAVYPVQQAQQDNRGYGPPPHAPAHGYRQHYNDQDLVYDSGLGVYLVVGYPDYYFLDNSYYRHSNDGWYYSQRADRDWQAYNQDRLPPGLAKKYRGKDNNHGHANDRGHDGDYGHDGDRERDNDRGYDNGHGNNHN